MNSTSQIGTNWKQAFVAGCGRFVPAQTEAADVRLRQTRLVGTALVAPFLLSAALFAATDIGSHLLAALACTIFAMSWSIALLVANGRALLAERVGLAAAAAGIGTIVAASGGLAAPAAALLAVLPIEARWIAGPKGMRWGLAAAGAALVLPVVLAPLTGLAGAAPSGWAWLGPVLYAGLLLARLPQFEDESKGQNEESRDRLEDRLNAAVLALSAQGEVEGVSSQTERVLGLPHELIGGGGLFERIRVSDRVAFRCAVADAARGVASSLPLSLRLPSADGAPTSLYRHFELEVVPASAGGATGILRPAGEIEALKSELAEARRIAGSVEVAKARFLATVSHELRTPLNAIIGFSEMMLHEPIAGPLEPKQKEHVGLIRDAGRHLLSVVNSILDVSKIESGTYQLQPEPFCLRNAAALCVSMVEQQAVEKSLRLTTALEGNLSEVECDQRAVQQIIINLLSNAIKFTPEGGIVTLSASTAAGRLEIAVEDNGIGIDEEDLSRLGQPFMQVRNDYTRQYEGTGLGLCLVRGLVELHGGTMSIESAPGQGTAVRISLPLAADRERNGKEDEHAATQIGEDGHGALKKIA